MSIPLRYDAYEVADISPLDFMDAFRPPMGDYVPTEKVGDLFAAADLSDMLPNKCLNEIVDPIDDQAAAGLLFLFGGIAAIKPRSKDLLRLCAGHWQCDATVRSNGVFTQPGPGARKAIHN